MTPLPSHRISAEEAIALLRAGQPLQGCGIRGKLELPPGETWPQEIRLENCVVEHLGCLSVNFSKPVELLNCRFASCQFTFSYFLGGLTIDSCYFDDYLDFQAGGHNQGGAPVRIVNSRFAAFVNFFDCQYESAVIITDNHFLGGTNLLGKPHNIPVTFEVTPLLARNSGQLDVDGEDLAQHFDG
jgi:hypothetical protein